MDTKESRQLLLNSSAPEAVSSPTSRFEKYKKKDGHCVCEKGCDLNSKRLVAEKYEENYCCYKR